MLKMKLIGMTIALGIVSSQALCGVRLSDGAKDWLKTQFEGNVDVAFIKKKIAFQGCKQKAYQINFSRQVSDDFRIEAALHYNKGEMRHGYMTQRVSTHAYEVASWWDYESFSVGVSAVQQSKHEITAPLSSPLDLPRSQSLGLHVQMDGFHHNHEWEVSATHARWSASESEVHVPWENSYDNQLNLNYRVAF